MTSVFRIEQANTGLGICHTSNLCRIYDPVVHCEDDGFDNEALVANNLFILDWRFAFVSLEKLKEWFPNEAGRERMHLANAIIVEYETTDDEVIVSKERKQCLFDYDNAKKTNKYNVVTLQKIERKE